MPTLSMSAFGGKADIPHPPQDRCVSNSAREDSSLPPLMIQYQGKGSPPSGRNFQRPARWRGDPPIGPSMREGPPSRWMKDALADARVGEAIVTKASTVPPRDL